MCCFDYMTAHGFGMRARPFAFTTLALLAAVLFTNCSTSQTAAHNYSEDRLYPTRVPKKINFARDVRPIIESQCLECHNSKDAARNAGLNLETRNLAMTSGRQPPVIRPGDPKNSLFIQALLLDVAHPISMPPAPDKIWDARLKILEKWILDGAEWPENIRLVRPQDWRG
jgi:Planctomycete cytochrome C